MHSGRGEETPEVREGVVLPAQSEPWEGAPAGGQPWGQPPPQAEYPAFDGYGQQPAQPLPDADATQFFPPYPQAPAPGMAPGVADATQMLPPYPQAAADATQVLRPVPGEMPSEAIPMAAVPPMPQAAPFGIRPGSPGQAPGEPTQHLPRFDEYGYSAPPPEPQPQPQDDFAHLYRQDGPQPPPQPAPQAPYHQPHEQPHQPHQPYDQPHQRYDQPPAQRKKLSATALIGIVVAGCAVVGLVAGALISGGEGDAQAAATGTPSASASASSGSGSGGESAAEQQAKKLDALLKRSGSSRASVIQAVGNIQSCQNLGTAASELRSAATQRKDLVTQLGALSVDELPNHQALTDALTKAWNASAEADAHYAAWADQVANNGKKFCKNGSARSTGQTSEATRASGTATQNKKTAVKLWNTIAKKYGLTQRTYIQL